MFKLRSQFESVAIKCSHCGDDCPEDHLVSDGLDFCCSGCQIVYTVLKDNGLGDYYHFETTPGINQKSTIKRNYKFLDDPDVVQNLLEYGDDRISKISFTLPQIHCASCIWLLEHLHKLDSGFIQSRVNFLRKIVTLTFDVHKISLRQVVEKLALIGYPPELNLQKLSEPKSQMVDRSIYYKLGLAGFSFGNIMLLSFPEYLGFEHAAVKFYIGYINILLVLPVILYSGIDYLRSAWWTVKLKQISIDIPIAVGILTLFFRSVYEIVSHTGEGYLDSLAGFIFFLLIGKWFQQYTFYSIAFDRNYKSYFPISVLVKDGESWQSRSLDKLLPGDVILVKNEEIIPGDGILTKGKATIDYSFVTGESDTIEKKQNEKLFAGGKNIGANIQVQILKKVDQSYLTKLWDEDTFRIDKYENTQTIIHTIGKYFTITIMIIAVCTLIYWFTIDMGIAFNAFTAVLIVACPCALALAMPFSYGNIVRLFSKKLFYLKNVHVIDSIQSIDEIIFDKTGTITDHKNISVYPQMGALSDDQKYLIKSAANQSNHPISKAISHSIISDFCVEPDDFREYTGKGIEAVFGENTIKIGSSTFVGDPDFKDKAGVFVMINGVIINYFKVEHTLRQGVEDLITTLSKKYSTTILSGDNDREEKRLRTFFPSSATMIFNQSPLDKLQYIKSRQEAGHKVLMIGDGLNDAGALMQSDIGIVISEDSNNFTPACDAILGAKSFNNFLKYLTFISLSRWIITGAFFLAFIYNVVGLYFAVRGELSPVIAAVLMPVSSISVMIYGLISSTLLFKKYCE